MRPFRVSRPAVAVWLLTAYLGAAVFASQRAAAAMATAATRFLGSLTPEQRQEAALPFDGDDRLKWHYLPTESFPRKGLTIKAMSEPQRSAARDLLKSGLSQRGYLTATAIMDLEAVLAAMERGRIARDPELYFFSVFGEPSPKGAWGWRVEGHHLSVNVTVVNGSAVASSPVFMGTNPAEVRDGPKKGLRVLGAEEDAARTLLKSLDAGQLAAATLPAAAPDDIITTNQPKVDPLASGGIPASRLTASQRDLLMKLIEVYTAMMADDVAAERTARLKKAGIENIAFGWAGETERGRKHYYRMQGPTFLVEYDNTQNDANHIHSVWRDFEGDFGRDLLREHLKTVAH
jgi:uncharacterized protein DUF3500